MNVSPFHLLVVEDDNDCRAFLTDLLTGEGYRVTGVRTGEEALTALGQTPFDLLLLDIGLPGLSGLELLAHVRQAIPSLPVLLVTGRPSVETAVEGLRLRADDYMLKPFDHHDLLARIRQHLQPSSASEVVRCGELVLSFQGRRVWRGEQEVPLTRLEFELLACVVRRGGEVVTFDELLEWVWGCPPGSGDAEMVRVCVKRLRRKIEPDPERPCYLTTVRGVGYRWEVAPVGVRQAN